MKRERLDPQPIVRIMLDSGAYSIWRRGGEIHLDEYIEYCHDYADAIWMPVNLDVLPGKPGQRRTIAQVDDAAKKSHINCTRMRDAGLEPLPVFHQGENLRWLALMLEEGHTYVGLSPNKSLQTPAKMLWLDQCFDFLSRGGYPPVKLHAFGEVSAPILFGYPWYSADSTSWVLIGAVGQILVPTAGDDGGYNYRARPWVLAVSDGGASGTGKVASKTGRDFRSLGPRTKAYVEEYIDGLGYTYDQLAETHIARKRLNIRYYKKVVQAHSRVPYESKGGLFQPPSMAVDEWKFGAGFTFVFVSSLSGDHMMVMAEGCSHNLLSFFNLQEIRRPFDIREYAFRGVDYLKEEGTKFIHKVLRYA